MKLIAHSFTNAIAVSRILLKELGVKVSDGSLTHQLEQHPNYPSLLAISDVLKEFEVANQTFNMPRQLYDREALLFPFVAHSADNKGRFVLVHQIADGQVTISDEQKRRKKISKEDFLTLWSGAALYAEALPESGEDGYALKQAGYMLAQQLPAFAIVAVLLAVLLGANARLAGALGQTCCCC